ncbi:type II toxin-antitoxin system VapC family toxin [Ramlibacter sp. H39-3-26]|uniref:type II toxin-antitoxin system VapC family toxin n=1 Tax=Curvibacter soli TaxID=3031331 RepID=UPI0023DC80E0|nr:type II toxin-antitoxin system VapC family toxin [Ramlibacter sp. H39-3-26]MDF1486429.1 type II toxin-antitoxin system VapC family toxin [Ramlibacter sp. H39-3-26]
MRRPSEATYVDTSVWCAYCFNGPGSERAVAWLGQTDLSQAGTSWWTQTEFASALGILLRRKAFTRKQAQAARERFAELLDMVTRLNVLEQDYHEAAAHCTDAASNLRGGDALHLAIAQRHGCTALATLDAHMQASAERLGLKLIEWI